MAEGAAALAARGLRSHCRRLQCGEGSRRGWDLQCIYTFYRFCSTGPAFENINKPVIDRIIRVDHAGEYGANRIYAGQMAVLGRSSVGPVIRQMWNQEKEHLKKFTDLMVSYRVRPTILLPFWNIAGFVLGAGTALLGKKGAMACTVAVEESISHHYNNQIRTLMEEDPEKYKELLEIIKKFRDEELEHHDIGLEHDAELGMGSLISRARIVALSLGKELAVEDRPASFLMRFRAAAVRLYCQAPAYSVLKNAIQIGCKAAIFLSERI